MTGSLRLRLFAVLMAATGLIWLAAVAWIYVGSQREVEHVLDTRLQEAARMVVSLVGDLGGTAPAPGRNAADLPRLGSYERQLSCQIWSLDGRMIARSSGAPDRSLTDQGTGFSEREIDGEAWRVFAVEDPAKGVRVLVGDRIGLRERLVTDLIKGLMWPALLIAPLLGLMIWISLGRGLRPLMAMARDLSRRGADDMRPVSATHAPTELRPLAAAINALFEKVQLARQHEREVTAFAAHELRTPLAGLKTQAQVALMASEPAVVQSALRQIIVAVDRSTRLVRQLLAIAQLDASSDSVGNEPICLGALVSAIAEATPTPAGVAVEIAPELFETNVEANRECVELALRNLHENAIQHMIEGGRVRWARGEEPDSLVVEDEGPGIPPADMARVGTRFFRGRFKSPSGSGLGLAIVQLALKRAGAELRLANRHDRRGLRVAISFPGAARRSAASTAAPPGMPAVAARVSPAKENPDHDPGNLGSRSGAHCR